MHARTRCVFAWTSESACLRASSSPSRYFCVFVSARDRCLTPPPRPAQLSKLVRHLPQPRQPVVRQSQRVERLRTRARTGEREGVRERASLPCLRYRLQRTPPLLASLSFPPPPTPLSANQLGCNPTPPDGGFLEPPTGSSGRHESGVEGARVARQEDAPRFGPYEAGVCLGTLPHPPPCRAPAPFVHKCHTSETHIDTTTTTTTITTTKKKKTPASLAGAAAG